MNIQPLERSFLPKDFTITDWEHLQPYFEALQNRALNSRENLEHWLRDQSELEAVISEDACWRQIRVTLDTTNTANEEAFTYFMMEIEPKMKPYANALNEKLADCPYTAELSEVPYFPYLRNIKKAIELYREANVPLQAELGVLGQQFGSIAGKMTIHVNDQEYTLQQAAKFLHQSDRALREEVYSKVSARRLQDKDALNTLFDDLITKRHQVAVNAGFSNYRDYKFKELGRFDYGVKECEDFHSAVELHIMPIIKEIQERKRQKLGVDQLRPWDLDAEPAGTKPLEPFHSGEELVNKAIEAFTHLRPYFGECLATMQQMNRLDVESRKGKAPGGYNCPLAETGAPFIFMNAAGTLDDLITMMHEGGHAIHSFLCHDLQLSAFKEYPMEIAELASMSMELFSMDQWHVFFSSEDELKRAKMEELERVIDVLPWVATIDAFQHWIYTHPGHTREERSAAWMQINNRFSTGLVDWTGFEDYRTNLWQKQLHLYEVPFYYIEYGIAQLGAIAMWRQYKLNSEMALDNYMKALGMGYTLPLTELYSTAGIQFNFAPDYVQELAQFVEQEMTALA